ncbi:MAG: hypothetical protein K940chlam7_00072, partial [Chlamydiae bacterium]|nr:hypothetical protein [Chlamydiota bacterium]
LSTIAIGTGKASIHRYLIDAAMEHFLQIFVIAVVKHLNKNIANRLKFKL